MDGTTFPAPYPDLRPAGTIVTRGGHLYRLKIDSETSDEPVYSFVEDVFLFPPEDT
jgi:hypothetical protein